MNDSSSKDSHGGDGVVLENRAGVVSSDSSGRRKGNVGDLNLATAYGPAVREEAVERVAAVRCLSTPPTSLVVLWIAVIKV